MRKRISFEPVHYLLSGEGTFEGERTLDGKKYPQIDIDSRSAARYYYHHPIKRLVNTSFVGKSQEHVRIANSLLERFFNSNREYLLDSKGNTHSPNIVTNLFATKEKESYIVIPTYEQFEDILGLGFRAIKRGALKGMFGIGRERIEEVCKEYADRTNWEFQIAKKDMNQIYGKVTLKLSHRGARFSID